MISIDSSRTITYSISTSYSYASANKKLEILIVFNGSSPYRAGHLRDKMAGRSD